MQEDLFRKGKIISSWYEFTVVLKKWIYPLGYIQQAMMDWKNLRQGKGQNVQEYTQEFRKELWFWEYLFILRKLLSILLEDYIGICVIQYLCLILLTLMRYVCKLRTLNPRRVFMIFLQLNLAKQKKARKKGKVIMQLQWVNVKRGLRARIVKSKGMKRQSVGYYIQN